MMKTTDEIKIVSVIGAGSWGTTIANIIAENTNRITIKIWAYEKSVVSSINKRHENTEYLPGIKLLPNIIAYHSLKECILGSQAVILATPSKSIYDITLKIAKYVPRSVHIGYLTKGFCKIHNDIFTISQTIGMTIPHLKERIVAISGPSHAEEVSIKYHTCLNVAGPNPDSRRVFVDLLTNDYLQCRERDDIIGVDLGGTLKNPAAVAAGMISMLPQCGDNLGGALMSEALKEMISLARLFRLKDDVIIDISGLGDLVATALSNHSRNRRFGRDIAKQILQKGSAIRLSDRIALKLKPERVIERMSRKLHYLAEGAYAIEPLIELADKHNIPIPVYRSLYEVLLNKKDPSLLIETIKNPEKFDELYRKTKIQLTGRKSGLERISGKVFKDSIIQRTIEKFRISEPVTENARSGMASLIENLHDYTKKSGTASSSISEHSVIRKINEANFNSSIELLIRHYVATIVDHFKAAIKWIYLFYLKRFFLRKISRFRLRRDVTGNFEDINKIKISENIIYVSTSKTLYDYVFLITAIRHYRLPFPRFFVNKKALRSRFHEYIVRRSGGYIVDTDKFGNLLYRESLYQYISTMIEHGVPILYFPETISGSSDMLGSADTFFEVIINSMFTYTIEIVLVPIEISYESDTYSGISNDLSQFITVKFTTPFYLSDFTKAQAANTSISKVIQGIWERDVNVAKK